jgi:hypothetical protein
MRRGEGKMAFVPTMLFAVDLRLLGSWSGAIHLLGPEDSTRVPTNPNHKAAKSVDILRAPGRSSRPQDAFVPPGIAEKEVGGCGLVFGEQSVP